MPAHAHVPVKREPYMAAGAHVIEDNEAAHLIAQGHDYGHHYQEDSVPLMDYTELYSNGFLQDGYKHMIYLDTDEDAAAYGSFLQ